MILQTLKSYLCRDLEKLKQEINAYSDEKKLWITDKGINNSAGNLCLHLIGNLNTYIGAVLGNTGYIRNRDLEFSLQDVPRKDLQKMIDDTIEVVAKTMDDLKEEQLEEDYPVVVWKEKTSTEFLLGHLVTHLSYHLGQINYHRRLLDN